MAGLYRNPDFEIPFVAAIAGASLLALGWWLGGDRGVGIAGGVISVLGLVTSAFAARAIWSVRASMWRSTQLHRFLRRVDRIFVRIQRAREAKAHIEVRQQIGVLVEILPALPLPATRRSAIESLRSTIEEINTSDNRSLDRLAKSLLVDLGQLQTAIEIELDDVENLS